MGYLFFIPVTILLFAFFILFLPLVGKTISMLEYYYNGPSGYRKYFVVGFGFCFIMALYAAIGWAFFEVLLFLVFVR